MKAHQLSPVYLTVPMLMLSLSGCAGRAVPPAAGTETSFAVRPFRPLDQDGWFGNAICYGPHRDGLRPGGDTPSAEQIREDLNLMRDHWRLLRTYGSHEFGRTLCAEIRASGLGVKVMLGVWIAAEETRDPQGRVLTRDSVAAAENQREAEAAIALAAEYPDVVVAVCVGNETQVFWSPYPSPLDILIGHLRRVRAAVAVPVSAADDYQYWNKPESRTLAREVDFLTVHAHPLWNGRQLEDAVPWLREQVAAVRAMHPDRDLVIGETGWATSVSTAGEQARLIQGQTGEAQQAVFYDAARAWATAEQITTFVFEAFDENWKGGDDPAEVEKHWGLFRADRTAKAALGIPPGRAN